MFDAKITIRVHNLASKSPEDVHEGGLSRSKTLQGR